MQLANIGAVGTKKRGWGMGMRQMDERHFCRIIYQRINYAQQSGKTNIYATFTIISDREGSTSYVFHEISLVGRGLLLEKGKGTRHGQLLSRTPPHILFGYKFDISVNRLSAERNEGPRIEIGVISLS